MGIWLLLQTRLKLYDLISKELQAKYSIEGISNIRYLIKLDNGNFAGTNDVSAFVWDL